MKKVKIQVSRDATIGHVKLFDAISQRDLLEVFKKIPFLSGVPSTYSDEPYKSPGVKRLIFFKDDNSARQNFLSLDPNGSFSVRIDNFTSKRLYPVVSMEYRFVFFDHGPDLSRVSVVYKFKLRSYFSMLLFKLVAAKYMQKHIEEFLRDIVKEAILNAELQYWQN